MRNTLFKNYFWNSFYQVFILIIPFFVTPYVSRVIGAEVIGQYSYTRSIVAYFTLFASAGSNLYAQREIALAGSNTRNRNNIFWEIFLIRVILVCACSVFYLPMIFLYEQYSIFFAIQLLDVAATGIDITWFYQGIEDFGKIAFRNMIMKSMGMIFIFLFVHEVKDFGIYVLSYSLSNFLGQLWMWLGIRDKVSSPVFRELMLSRHLKGILALALPQAAIQVYLVIDKTMIELITSDSKQTGFYEMAQTFQRIGVSITTAFGSVTASRIASIRNQNNGEEIKIIINQACDIISLLGVPIAFGIAAIASTFVPFFLGEGYEPAAHILVWLCPLIVIIGFSNISGMQYMVPMGMQRQITRSTFAGLMMNIVMNAFLIPPYGAYGAAAASVMSETLVLIIQMFYIRTTIQWKNSGFNLLRSLLCSSCMYLLINLLESFSFFESSFLNFAIIICLSGIFYLILQILSGNQILKEIIHIFQNKITDLRG